MSNTVNRGQQPNDQQADTLYTAFGKVNDKFSDHDDLKQVQDASEKETPVNADSLPLIDSAAAEETPKLKWLSWVNVKATLKTYFDTLYNNLGLGETDTTAYRGDRGKIGYDHSQVSHAPSNATAAGATGDAHATTAHAPSNATANDTDANLKARGNHTGTQLASTISNFAATVRETVLTGLSTATNAAITATDTVLSALGKLQKQITDHFTTHPAPTNRDTRNEAAFTKNTAFNKDFGSAAGTVTQGNDSRLADSREWTADTIAQVEAEAGTDTTRRAWTAQRVAQAIAALSSGGDSNFKYDFHTFFLGGGLVWNDVAKDNVIVRISNISGPVTIPLSDSREVGSVLMFLSTDVNNPLSFTAGSGVTLLGESTAQYIKLFLLIKYSSSSWMGFTYGTGFGTDAGTACQGNDGRLPTTVEKSALAGMGTPSSTSKYVNGTYGTANPSGGADGDVYFQYE